MFTARSPHLPQHLIMLERVEEEANCSSANTLSKVQELSGWAPGSCSYLEVPVVCSAEESVKVVIEREHAQVPGSLL